MMPKLLRASVAFRSFSKWVVRPMSMWWNQEGRAMGT